MRNLGEQWIEDGRMYKAVAGSNCNGCAFGKMCKSQRSMTDIHICDREDECPIDCSDMIIKDLGPVNEAGCLAEERTGFFPIITKHFLNHEWRWLMYAFDKDCNITIHVWGDSLQEAIDRWNRRNV